GARRELHQLFRGREVGPGGADKSILLHPPRGRILSGCGGIMRRDLPVLAVLLGTGIASFQPCLAAAADRTKHLTFSASGGYQTYAMSDVNRAIESTLAAYTGARAHKNKIKGGPG